jgi:UPF0716 protein FxsA
MEAFRLFLKFIDRDSFFKLILVLLAYSLVPLAEIFLFLYLGTLVGSYLVLVLAAVVGLVGGLIAARQIQRALAKLKKKIRLGQYPGREFVDLTGILVGGILFITPGFITDLFGLLLFLPVFREAVGRALVKRLHRSFKEIHEYLKLKDAWR